jgi:hypothetical protein
MALVTIASDAGVDAGTAAHAPHLAGDLVAGENLLLMATCYIKASDGKVYMTNATAAGTETTRLAGICPRAAVAGQAVTLIGAGVRFRYASGSLTPGAILFLGATAGRLDTAATTGDAVGAAQAVSDTDVRLTRLI